MNSLLNTNEIKNAAAAGVTFSRISSSERESVWAILPESPNAPQRLTIKHSETGSGVTRRRRSLVRFDYSRASTVDTTKVTTTSAYTVLDAPIGYHTAVADYHVVLSYLNSFMAQTGAATGILFDNTGNGSRALLNGEV
jgi:hypothetical protein